MNHSRLLRTSVALALAGMALGATQPSWACATCGCVLSKDWLGGQGMGSAGWSAGLSFDFIDQNQFHTGTSNISTAQAEQLLNSGTNANPGGNEVEVQTLTRTTTLNLDYNTPEWGVSVQLPIVDRYHQTYSNGLGQTATDAGVYPADYNYSQVNSLGDLRVIGRYSLAADGTYGVTFGIKLPTGKIDDQFVVSPGAIDASVQAGTGSTDAILGGYYTSQSGNLGWFTQATWQHALASQAGYTPGDSLSANLGLRYAGIEGVTPLVQLNFVHRSTDSGFGASTESDGTPLSGGTLVYLAPGISGVVGNGLRAYAYVQLPLYQKVNGVQLTAKNIISIGIRKSF